MSLAQMFASGPTLKAKKPKVKNVKPTNILKDWTETYRCIGPHERSANDILIKINRNRNENLSLLRVSSLLRRLRSMEALGFVSQRKTWIAGSTKPVMLWKRVKKPCQ